MVDIKINSHLERRRKTDCCSTSRLPTTESAMTNAFREHFIMLLEVRVVHFMATLMSIKGEAPADNFEFMFQKGVSSVENKLSPFSKCKQTAVTTGLY